MDAQGLNMALNLPKMEQLFKHKRIDESHDPDTFDNPDEIIKFSNILQANTSGEVELTGANFVDICTVTFTITNPKTLLAIGNIGFSWSADLHHIYTKLRIKVDATEIVASERTIDYDFVTADESENVLTGDNLDQLSTQYVGTLATGTHTIKLIGKCNDSVTVSANLGNLIVLLI